MDFYEYPWFAQERTRIADVLPRAVFQSVGGKVFLTAQVPSTNGCSSYRFGAIYDEHPDKSIAGVRVYPLSPTMEQIKQALPAQTATEIVERLFAKDAAGNACFPVECAVSALDALAHANALMTLLEQAIDQPELLDKLFSAHWRSCLPPFGVLSCGQRIFRRLSDQADPVASDRQTEQSAPTPQKDAETAAAESDRGWMNEDYYA